MAVVVPVLGTRSTPPGILPPPAVPDLSGLEWRPLLLAEREAGQDADPNGIVGSWTETGGLHTVEWTTLASATQQLDAMALRVWEAPPDLLLNTGTHVLVVRIRPVVTPSGANWGSLIMGGGWAGGNDVGAFVPTRSRVAGFRQPSGGNLALSVLQASAGPINNLTNLGKPAEFRVVANRGGSSIGGVSVNAVGVAAMESQGSSLAPDGVTRRIVLAFGSTSTTPGTTNTATFYAEYAYARIPELTP